MKPKEIAQTIEEMRDVIDRLVSQLTQIGLAQELATSHLSIILRRGAEAQAEVDVLSSQLDGIENQLGS